MAGRTVYRYVGRGLGTFLPGRSLPLPASHTVAGGGLVLEPVRGARLDAELAVSRLDANTFSTRDDGNDAGSATRARLTFDRPIPKDLSLVLRGKTGNPVTVAAALVRKGQEVQAQPGSGRYMTEVLFNVAPDIGIPADQSFSLRELSHIELDAPSCEKTCDLRLLEIERDGFSRRNALLQLPFKVEANGRLLYFCELKVGSMISPIGPE